MIRSDNIRVSTEGYTEVVNISEEVQDIITRSELGTGVVNICVIGSTAAITTIEYEPGLKKDIKEILESIAPVKGHYQHHKTWHDDNGSAHIRASIIGPSLTLPFSGGKLLTGTWQQIVLMDFDTRPRDREVIVQVVGD